MVAEPVSRLRNPLSLAGVWLTTLAAFAFIAYFIVDWLGLLASPYAGLFGFVAVPALFLFGLVLIPLGMWREDRRRRAGHAPWPWPVFDLRIARTRRVLAALALLTLVNLTIVTVAGFGTVHYSESTAFCGQVCHTPMRPEFTAHMNPPHANITCVQCHVSPGASGFVKAKLAGSRQLYLVMRGSYDRPIPSPARGIPVAADTCARCHTPGHPARDVIRVIHSYADDQANTDSTTSLTMYVATIHWHARATTRVEYVATDATGETIPYVRVTDERGAVTEYTAEGATAKPPPSTSGQWHRMDCLDCHTRPAHQFSASADRAVNAALAAGLVSRSLPFVHREMVAALTVPYSGETAADAGIAKRLTDAYHRADGEVADLVAATQQLYRRNVFPEMNVGWGTYQSELGHADAPGCFRCHDDSHKTPDGRAVRQDCELCHSIR